MSERFETMLAELQEERQRLDGLLDDVMAQYALFEEDMNVRMKSATPEQQAALMAERSRVEEVLGIVALVERIDAIRDRVATLRAQMGAGG